MEATKLQSLSEIFTNKIFKVPDFQRGYSWESGQLEDLWEDLQILKPDKTHYTGMITVKPVDVAKVGNKEKWENDSWLLQKGYKAYYVIDGQQRLTSIIILIHEILDTLDDGEGINFGSKDEWVGKFWYCSSVGGYNYESFIFGYEKDDPSNEYFKTKILGRISSSADKYPETLYTEKLKKAKGFFKKKIKDLSKEEKEKIFSKIVNGLRFNYYEIDDSLDEYVVFETMNNRGKRLSTLELLKNRLMYLSTLLNEEEEEKRRLRNDINETWKTIYEYLGKNKHRPLDDEDFLRNHWIMYDWYDREKANRFVDSLLKERFTVQNIFTEDEDAKIIAKDIRKYVDSLRECVKQWYYIHNIRQSNYSKDIKYWVEALSMVGFGAFEPMLMAVFAKEGECEEEIVDLLKECERFVFLVFAISDRRANTKDSYFYHCAYWYYSEEIDINGEKVGIKWLADSINTCTWDYFNPKRFLDKMTELFEKNDRNGYYGWNKIRYFLYMYEKHLEEVSNERAKVSWLQDDKWKKAESIEHIFPQTPTDEYWQKRFGRYDDEEQNRLKNSLGNLLLLRVAKNSELQNYDFETKKHPKGKDIGYYNGSFSEIEVAQCKEWTAKQIKERGMKMLEFMENEWEISFDEFNVDKEELLGLKGIKV